ncbi:hypothetical protein ACFYZ4_37130 [Streptomyces sp. NPDC001513]|uniref:hypothetical protein n=1 Tax=Streptomyces sp. NPDC001513 TaxID=3364580 RepID=UPI0036B1CFA4
MAAGTVGAELPEGAAAASFDRKGPRRRVVHTLRPALEPPTSVAARLWEASRDPTDGLGQ